jgi:hypothetical protein
VPKSRILEHLNIHDRASRQAFDHLVDPLGCTVGKHFAARAKQIDAEIDPLSLGRHTDAPSPRGVPFDFGEDQLDPSRGGSPILLRDPSHDDIARVYSTREKAVPHTLAACSVDFVRVSKWIDLESSGGLSKDLDVDGRAFGNFASFLIDGLLCTWGKLFGPGEKQGAPKIDAGWICDGEFGGGNRCELDSSGGWPSIHFDRALDPRSANLVPPLGNCFSEGLKPSEVQGLLAPRRIEEYRPRQLKQP